jgi:hypothetical protein
MSEHTARWLRPMTTELTEALEGVRIQARLAGDQQYVLLAETYIVALDNKTPYLSQWHPDPPMTERFIKATAVVAGLYHKGDILGVLQHTYAVLSALPGDPGSTPPEVPPPPDDSEESAQFEA